MGKAARICLVSAAAVIAAAVAAMSAVLLFGETARPPAAARTRAETVTRADEDFLTDTQTRADAGEQGTAAAPPDASDTVTGGTGRPPHTGPDHATEDPGRPDGLTRTEKGEDSPPEALPYAISETLPETPAQTQGQNAVMTAAVTERVPETTRAPETTRTPETTRVPVTTRAPVTTYPPETTRSPVTTRRPETARTPQTEPFHVTSSEPAVTEPEPEIITPAETSPPPSPETAPLSSGVTVPDLKLGQSARAVLVAPNGDLVPGTWKNASGMIFFKADVPELQFGESYRWWDYSSYYGRFRFGTYKCIGTGLVTFVEDAEYTIGPVSWIVHDEEIYTIPPGTWW